MIATTIMIFKLLSIPETKDNNMFTNISITDVWINYFDASLQTDSSNVLKTKYRATITIIDGNKQTINTIITTISGAFSCSPSPPILFSLGLFLILKFKLFLTS